MAQNSGGIWHDYKGSSPTGGNRRGGHRWPWFAAGLLLPLAGVLIIGGRPDASPEAQPTPVLADPAPADDAVAGVAYPDDQMAALAIEAPFSDEPASEAALAPAAGEDGSDIDAASALNDPNALFAATAPLVLAGAAPPDEMIDIARLRSSAQLPLRAAATPLILAPPPDELEILAALDSELPAADIARAADGLASVDMKVSRGDTLERMFRRHELSIGDMMAVLGNEQARRHLSILRPGDVISVRHDQGRVMSLRRELDEIRVLEVSRAEDDYVATIGERAVETRIVTAHAVIDSSLFNAGRDAGLPDSVTMNVAGLFQWDVDFVLDIRQGDRFSVAYQELWRDGERLRPGTILAAEFVNRGRTHRAVRFEMDERADYFTPEGRSVRKAFIRAPVDFTRISSRFNPNRRHPVLHTIRAHRGVDYAAPSGTPIKAAGDGRVIFRGVQGGYGNTVIVQHGGNITTLYAHMSRFHSQVRNGTRVRQGQIIGYVGMTGLASGPHLHYEYRISGVHRDPLTVELPPAEPVPAKFRDRFGRETAPLLSYLDQAREAGDAQLAMSGR